MAGTALLVGALISTQPLLRAHVAVQIAVRVVLLGLLVAVVIAVFVRFVLRAHMSTVRKNAALALTTVFVALIGLEAVFTALPRSHSFGQSLAARRWHDYFWKPLNAYNYRDKPVPADLQQRDAVYVIGDSFTAGYGIVDTADRFSDVLDARLPDNVAVVNLGIRGSDTRSATARLAAAAVAPRVVVYQYFGNDIEPCAKELGHKFVYAPYAGVPGFLRFVIENSYLVNFVYWMLPRTLNEDYSGFLSALYADPTVTAAHEHDLGELLRVTEQHGARLIVVVFPFMHAPHESRFFVEPVATFYRERGVAVLDVSDLIRDLEPKECVVNPNDSHPSIEVHRRVGEALAEMMKG